MIERRKLLQAVLISVLIFGAAFVLCGLIYGLVLLGNVGAVILMLLLIALLTWAVYERD